MLLLLGMIFLHIVDDYYLQGWLASAKQKEWWQKNAPDKLHKHDYIVALFMHSFSWTFMIMLIPGIYGWLTNNINSLIILAFALNLGVHMLTDHAKANLKVINLIEDQFVHLAQVYITWFIFVMFTRG